MIRRVGLALAALILGAAAPAAKTPPDHAASDLDALKQASNPAQAAAIEARILAAWHARLTPSVQLLVERGQGTLQAGKPRDAIADLDAAIALQPEAADLWRMRAEMRFAGGDEQGAVSDLAQSLSREPRCFPALADLSHFAEAREDWARALAAWQALLRVDPKAGQADQRLLRLQHKVSGQPT